MELYQVDAFTDKVFHGNPAAVIIEDQWPAEALMQSIGSENNLAETAFVVAEGDAYRIRWFTPAAEVDLCGHATLAAAWVMFHELGFKQPEIHFHSKSGLLKVSRSGDWLTLNFPVDRYQSVQVTHEMQHCTTSNILEAYEGRSDFMFVMADQKAIQDSHFNLDAIRSLGNRGVIVTAEGNDVDFVSRFFAPAFGINEDPVTGSAHTTLTPYWANRLGKLRLNARQLSERGGYLKCELNDDRVLISGQAVLFMKGRIHL